MITHALYISEGLGGSLEPRSTEMEHALDAADRAVGTSKSQIPHDGQAQFLSLIHLPYLIR